MLHRFVIEKKRMENYKNKIPKLFKHKPGEHTTKELTAAGFECMENSDTAVCKNCKLEISRQASNKKPHQIHLEQKPNCLFVRSLVERASSGLDFNRSISSTSGLDINLLAKSTKDDSKLKSDQTIDPKKIDSTLFEAKSLKQIRIRTFSHWSKLDVPSKVQMIEAGFFFCNVRDRVICIYCNLICQQWSSKIDDPWEIHKICSPKCIYVKAKLALPRNLLVFNNDAANQSLSKQAFYTNNLNLVSSKGSMVIAACNPSYAELPKRHASFSTWPNENLPSVDDFVRAGFFYTGTKTIVTCFYCNGSLQYWSATDNPMIEHARWFPHCAYAKQLCGDEMYQKIQKAQCALHERARLNETINSHQLLIPDENALSTLIEARLHLPECQRLLKNYFSLSIVQRCCEVQLRLNQADFVSDLDLYMACLILQKQIEQFDGINDRIVVPSIRMKQIREQNEIQGSKQLVTENRLSLQRLRETKTINRQNENKSNNTIPLNPCVLCLTEEKRLACIPCGHLATCVPCGHSLRSCPICRREIEAFVRLYI